MSCAYEKDQIISKNRSPFEPVVDENDDFFGYRKIAHFVAETILGNLPEQSRVFSIEGPWGSGKSTVIEFLIQQLKGSNTHRTPEIVLFSPWRVRDAGMLYATFFSTLASAFNDVNQAQFPWHSRKRLVNIIRKHQLQQRLNYYSVLTTAASPLLKALGPWYFVPFTLFARVFGRTPTLESQKNRIEKLIKTIAGERDYLKIVVVVDDLDRLTPDEASQVIKLVKAVANFPRVSYLLAYDGDVLSKGMEKAIQVHDGQEYLGKIVQQRIPMPSLGAFDIRRFLKTKLQGVFLDDADWSSRRANIVLDTWAGRLLRTPRDVIKVFEAIKIRWAKLKPFGADLLDLIWLQIVLEKASNGERNLYDWVFDYTKSLEAIAIGGRVLGTKHDEDRLNSILKNLGWREPQKRGEYTARDYHHLGTILTGITAGAICDDSRSEPWLYKATQDDFQKAQEGKRLSSPWHWRLYSSFELSPNALSDDVWDTLRAKVHGDEDVIESLEVLSDIVTTSNPNADVDNIGDQLLNNILFDLNESPDHAQKWFEAVLRVSDKLFARSQVGGFGFSKEIEALLRRFGAESISIIPASDEKTKFLEYVFKNSPSVSSLSEIYRTEFFRRKEGSSHHKPPFMSDKEYEAVSKKFEQRLSSTSPRELAESPDAWAVVYAAINLMGDETSTDWFNSLISDDDDLVSILEALEVIKSSSQTEAGIPHTWLANFADADSILHRLSKIVEARNELSERAAEILRNWHRDDED